MKRRPASTRFARSGLWQSGVRGCVVVLVVACAAEGPPPDLAMAPCRLPGVDEALECGTLHVPEDRSTGDGRTIGVHVTRARATGPSPAPDPLFLFSGGPGLGASDGAAQALVRWSGVRADRDLVLVDLRGTGRSHALHCPPPGDPDDPYTYLHSVFEIERVRACRDVLAGTADLPLYTTTMAVGDVDDVRRGLGYDAVNLYGVSYGSLVAQEYVRRHGDHVRAAILHGPVPPTGRQLLDVPQRVDSLIARTVAACEADSTCARAYPAVGEHLRTLQDRRAPDSVTASVALDGSGQRQVAIPYPLVAELLQFMLYSAEGAADIPAVLGLIANDRFAPLVPVIARIRRSLYGGRLAWGLYLSVYCGELLPDRRADALTRARETLSGAGELEALYAACEVWPRTTVPADFRHPVETAVPVIVISGELDPVTPPVFGDAIARHLTTGRHVVRPARGPPGDGARGERRRMARVRGAPGTRVPRRRGTVESRRRLRRRERACRGDGTRVTSPRQNPDSATL